jgi:hypothetical protein
MIVELADGREFRVPDNTEEAKVDELVKALLAAESKASAALATVQAVQAEVAALRKQVEGRTLDTSALQACVAGVEGAVLRVGSQIEKAVMADTMLVADTTGEYNRSRKVM